MFEFIPGKPIEHPNDDHKEQLIRKVAELQILTPDYRPLNTEYRWNYNPELCRRLARAEAKTIGTQDARKKYIWVADQLSALELPDHLPKGICHCDFHFSNVLFQDDQLVGLLDFDDANYTYLVFDLVSLIDSWAWPFQSDTLDFAGARDIVKAYNSYRPLSEIERRHIYDVHKLSILFDCIWFLRRGPAEDFYEKRKIQFLNDLGWRKYFEALFPV
jgi:Ser/Thr protein kinase RdoA (MazF antagonist)